MNWLWITPKSPYPPTDGARMASFQLLKHLDSRLRISLLIGSSETQVGRLSQLSAWLKNPMLPITMATFGELSVPGSGSAPDAVVPEAVVYDGLHTAAHSQARGEYRRPAGFKRVVYRAHNFESELWEQKAQRLGMAKRSVGSGAILRWQARKVLKFEQSLIRQSDVTACVSEEDRQKLLRQVPGANIQVVPIGQDFDRPLGWETFHSGDEQGDPLPVLFVGRMDWMPNREGLEWFLRNVWPIARRKRDGLTLAIAGSGNSAWIKPYADQPGGGIRFLGRVDDLRATYESSALSIVPIFFGSGTRVKAIESSRYGRACLSTELGVEGTGLVPGASYLRAETAEQWIGALLKVTLKEAEKTGNAAFSALQARFDSKSCAERMLALMEGR